MINLLVVRLHDEFAERTAAVSVNLEQMKPNKTQGPSMVLKWKQCIPGHLFIPRV